MDQIKSISVIEINAEDICFIKKSPGFFLFFILLHTLTLCITILLQDGIKSRNIRGES